MEINIWAVLVAALANFFIGFMFHGPFLGKLWMKLANITSTGNEKFSDMIPQMVWNYLANVVCAGVLAVLYLYASASGLMSGTSDICNGLLVTFLAWLGFIVTGSSMEVIWMGRSYKLWLFELAASLVSILAMGAIIASWQ